MFGRRWSQELTMVACCWGLCRDIVARRRPCDWRLLWKSVARAGDSPRERTQPCGSARSLCWAGAGLTVKPSATSVG